MYVFWNDQNGSYLFIELENETSVVVCYPEKDCRTHILGRKSVNDDISSSDDVTCHTLVKMVNSRDYRYLSYDDVRVYGPSNIVLVSSMSTNSSPSLPDKYRAVKKTDVIEIRRNTNCMFNPEPTTLCKVRLLCLCSLLGVQAML